MENLGSEDPGAASASRSAYRAALVATVGLVGVLAMHHPMILSGFHRIQTDMGDTRLLNYILEHGWLWISKAPRHENFWDAPFFYPVPNVMAFSDCMFSYGPFYWPYRAAGLAADTAFGAWMATMTALNYAVGVLLFRRGLGFGAPATAAAAGLIAFGAPRVNQLHHPQLLPSFYLLFALHALCRITRDQPVSVVERASWWVIFGLSVAAQFYGGYYLGWFFGVGLAVATIAALILPSTRGRVAALARRDWWAAALGATVAAAALLPFFAHYLPVAREFGRGFGDIQKYTQPTVWSWWNAGAANWWWGWIDRRWPVGTLYPEELRLGLGFATTATCGLGIYLSRRSSLVRVALAATLFGVSAMTFPMTYIGAAAACFALACLFREADWAGFGASTFALATVVLLVASANNHVALSLTFAMIAFCMIRIWNQRGRKGGWVAPGAALAALGFHSLPMDTALFLAGLFATAGALAAYSAPSRRIEVGLGSLGLWLAATAWLSVENAPWIFNQAAMGTVLGWSAAGDSRFRPSPVKQLMIIGIALLPVCMLYDSLSLWLAFSSCIPGSGAIRIPSRVVLVLLVPAALGLASLIERLDHGRWCATAWCLAIVCLAEQTGTTETFDRDASRRQIAKLVRQVDRRAGSFYYRSHSSTDVHYYLQLDAMWAALDTGIPTINGISGCAPTGWKNLDEADSTGRQPIEKAMQEWCDCHGLRRVNVQCIGRQADAADSR